MGKQLDSLADVVSFGVAPGMIIYQLLRISFAQEEDGLDVSIAMVIACIYYYRVQLPGDWQDLILIAAQHYSFKGLPIPAVGLLVASFPLIYWNVNEQWVFRIIVKQMVFVCD